VLQQDASDLACQLGDGGLLSPSVPVQLPSPVSFAPPGVFCPWSPLIELVLVLRRSGRVSHPVGFFNERIFDPRVDVPVMWDPPVNQLVLQGKNSREMAV
jgi:hypothetical protein